VSGGGLGAEPPSNQSVFQNRPTDSFEEPIFFHSREKPQELYLRTPLATGALRGTELHAHVGAGGRTVVTMFDGEVELSNALGRVLIGSGEQGIVEPGRPPVKTAVIEATNDIIQWCLYYPGVLDPAELHLRPAEEKRLEASLAWYRQGDLLEALRRWPAGRVASSAGERAYRAALLLEVGQVAQAERLLAGLPEGTPAVAALRSLIAAVKFEEAPAGLPSSAATASEWLALSYHHQSRGRLVEARQAARRATELAPTFGFAWTRLAELEFSFGRNARAEHAQAFALQGFLLSAANRSGAARRSFEQAIALDGALGNAWLGRGLTEIRRGHSEEGRLDLQIAAALEPNRSLLRSYLGKAFSQVGSLRRANAELDRAKAIDPNDPTPWLYSAIVRKQENRYNTAVEELERSLELNEQRRVYRSRFLLDQDRAIRGTNLAAIYQNNGLIEQSVREAARAVQSDYASAPAYLFLANSYNALRDPARVQLRYETAWFNELLLANLLSPVGGGPLSQFVSEQEYSKLFERDGLGLSTIGEYFSRGQVRAIASQYGTVGNLSYAFDGEYLGSDGVRPNNRLTLKEAYATFKLQLRPQDTLFFQTKFASLETGDVSQRYDPRDVETRLRDHEGIVTREPNRAALSYKLRETQLPALLLLGWRHEWSPGNQTLLLLGRLASEQRVTSLATRQTELQRDTDLFLPPVFQDVVDFAPESRDRTFFDALRPYVGRGPVVGLLSATLDLDYRSSFESSTAELQQICTFGPNTVLVGGRYQRGEFRTDVRLTNLDTGGDPFLLTDFDQPPARQDYSVVNERFNIYLYDLWRITPWLSVTAGLAYDALRYPDNFRNVPINGREASLDQFSPKGGLMVQPWRGATIRAAYTEAVSGTSFDESVRLEPVQVAGFLQAYRTAISESLVGSVAGSRYRLAGLSLEQKLPSRTYLGLEYSVLTQDVDRTIGVFDDLERAFATIGVLPSSLVEEDRYREDILTATANQLLGENWAFGARYRYTHSRLRQKRPEAGASLAVAQEMYVADLANFADSTQEAGLHELSLGLLFNHPSGLFARGEAAWYQQNNDFTLTVAVPGNARPLLRTRNRGAAGDDFWQFNLLAGYRFHRNQCELACGLLNITGQDYRLNPLTPYLELARERTFVLRCRLTF
jgi:tetratricopeptide (TPR) repeat protein